MEILGATYSFYFARPWWLLAFVILAAIVWLGAKNLSALSGVRRWMAIILRCLLISILIGLLARFTRTETNEQLTEIIVIDRSLSIPAELQAASFEYLAKALEDKPGGDQLAVVDIAEAASISKLPSGDIEIRKRNTTLNGQQSRLSDGIQMAMAIAPPNTAVRILLISEGNETAGDLKEAARIAAINKIPIDVLPLYYNYESEVIFKRLAAPSRARSGETVSLRFILNSTKATSGNLFLNLNGKAVDLDPATAGIVAEVELKAGTNVKTVSLPLGTRGMHEFEAIFVPDDAEDDRVTENNRASALTFVAGPGHVLVVDVDGSAGITLAEKLKEAEIDARFSLASELPGSLARLMDTDAVILVNTDCSNFTYQQQEMISRYVTELGGGLVMVGGAESFGAGGWIGSPIAEILPVDLDPPQKKQLPKGALVLIMHSCEMPQGNLWGERIATAAVQTLSRLDLVGILAYKWDGTDDWVYPLSSVGDKEAVISSIKKMQIGDMPDLGSHLGAAYLALMKCDAAQKHIIIISDGDPQPPTKKLLDKMKEAGITCTGVAVFPHSPADVQSLLRVAQLTGGRFYDVKDPQTLPQIFIKEAQVVRRSLIVEETFSPQLVYSLSEITKGLSFPLPNLDGYVLTGAKSGLNQMILSSNQGDPILATCQAGLGRCVAFTSSVDSRWASGWLSWDGSERFWEQVVRWAAKPAQAKDCEVLIDVQGRSVNVNVEAVDPEGKFLQLAHIDAQVIEPDMSSGLLELGQVGPGQFQGQFDAPSSGSYIVNLRYRKVGEDSKTYLMQTPVTVPFAPEFRDLSDNAALLAEVSSITGGRILSSDPAEAELFSYEGLEFPKSELAMTKPLMLIWLIVFLLDVAVRRIAVDVRAVGRKIAEFVKRPMAGKRTDKTIDQLRMRQKKLREQLTKRSRADTAVASKRFVADESYVEEAPKIESQAKAKEPEQKEAAQADGKKKDQPEEGSHIEQLLKAKRKAIDKNKKKEED